MRDIILVMSDQHGKLALADTPFLDQLASEGQSFAHAYCPSPLCVPSRMSFLSGRLPHELNIFNNDTTLGIDVPTLAHAMGAKGYHTVLIGRMHFKGDDQHHGFDERIGLDITSQYWGSVEGKAEEYGAYVQTTNMKHCQRVVGGGYSPVMAYDDSILEAAIHYLRQKHDQPLFVIVGFYGPHFPYVCEPALYEKYKERFAIDDSLNLPADEVYANNQQASTPEHVRNINAAYCGLVEMLDRRVHQLFDIVQENCHDPVFIYTSDHGEQAGKRGLFGKQTLYEEAIRVPMILHGKGMAHEVRQDPVSLLHLTQTILALGDADLPNAWGQPLSVKDQVVKVEQVLNTKEGWVLLEAVIKHNCKLVRYGSRIVLSDLDDQPLKFMDEALVDELKSHLLSEEAVKRCLVVEAKQRLDHELLKKWGTLKQPCEKQRFKIPEQARKAAIE